MELAMSELTKVAQEMREGATRAGITNGTALNRWANRIEAAQVDRSQHCAQCEALAGELEGLRLQLGCTDDYANEWKRHCKQAEDDLRTVMAERDALRGLLGDSAEKIRAYQKEYGLAYVGGREASDLLKAIDAARSAT